MNQERNEAESQRRSLCAYRQQCYHAIAEQAGTMLIEWDSHMRLQYATPGIKQFALGNCLGEAFLSTWDSKWGVHPQDIQRVELFCTGVRKQVPYLEGNFRLQEINGAYALCRVTLTSLYGEEDKLQYRICTVENLEECGKSEVLLKFRAEYDMVTGIYNQQSFEREAQVLLEAKPLKKYAVIAMDINRFKYINDLYGTEEGDHLLCLIAAILAEQVAGRGVCSRINSDVFCLCVAYSDFSEMSVLMENMEQKIKEEGLKYRVRLSFGICPATDSMVPIHILCDRASLALRTIKGNLIQRWAVYDKAFHERQLDEGTIEDEMERALEEGQFLIYLQPKHSLATGKVVGAEALVRWNHPREGLLVPDRFIPLFERNGFIVMLDYYVWEETCKVLRGWLDQGIEPVPVSVNVSRVHAHNPEFYKKLLEITARYGLPQELLELELTESTFVEDPQELYLAMENIKNGGFQFSMDDFGSGYSSLNMLRSAPVDTIKLDREFLNETAVTEKGKIIIKFAIEMVKNLGLHVVAEGVETGVQADMLREAGCNTAQGYFFSRPMPLSTFEQFVFDPRKAG